MPSNYSDHTLPQINITSYLPEVYRSEVNDSVFKMAFNRHLTKDDTQSVSGVIGQPNPQALINRQIAETTPHRQAYQLAPTMYTQVGSVQTALSFKSMQAQLSLVGVDMARYQLWGNTLQFNWIPPVNIDMLVNYRNYYWQPITAGTPAQYMTIENRCNKAASKVNSYQKVLDRYGSSFVTSTIDYVNNAFVLSSKLDTLFVNSFVFITKSATSTIAVQNVYWTVSHSTYDVNTNSTSVYVVESIATPAQTSPQTLYSGQWWYNTSVQSLYTWTGAIWALTSSAQSVTVSIVELLSVYQTEANCFCNRPIGWDLGPWDDNQIGTVLWNTPLFDATNTACIKFTTELGWTSAHGIPQRFDLWYDAGLDVLKQWDGTYWATAASNFSAMLVQTTGTGAWDISTSSCTIQTPNQWTQQNNWVHKSEVQSFAGVKQAQLPIFEYNSNLELNEWVKDTRVWKYRLDPLNAFSTTSSAPTRLELEPVKGYQVLNNSLYLFDKTQTVNRDIDYTSTFSAGFEFKLADDSTMAFVYTVTSSIYRELTTAEIAALNAIHPASFSAGYLVTVVQIAESFVDLPTSHNVLHGTAHLEPIKTSHGDVWRGYHIHWLLDVTSITTAPAAPQSWDLTRRLSLTSPIIPIATADGILYVGTAHQELTATRAGVITILLDPTLQYDPLVSNTYATPNSGNIRVYINGVRQYSNYVELTAIGSPNFTVVGSTSHTTMTIPYVTGIQLNTALHVSKQGSDIILIEVGPAAFADMGMTSIPVRTIADETLFSLGVANGTQPVYESLVQYRQVEQTKTSVNQYPLFNVYNIITGDLITASSIFDFAEDSTYPVNAILQRRIVASLDGKEFQFNQRLLDSSDRQLYGYRNVSLLPANGNVATQLWWYNPNTNLIQGWDGKAWTTRNVLFQLDNTISVHTPTISSTMPTTPASSESSLWYNSASNILYKWTTNALTHVASWMLYGPSVLVGTDSSIQTVWRHGINNEQFVPQYVDVNRNPISTNSALGDWQLPDQWTFNPEHRNKSSILLSEVSTHFSTILTKQPQSPGVQQGGVFARTQDQFNYGLGGTIKEHNDGFDTLISSFNVSNTNIVGVIEFAAREYAASLLAVQDLYDKFATSLISQYTPESIVSLSSVITADIITRHQQNQSITQIYVDTSAFNPVTSDGIAHWISTPAMFGFCAKHKPHLNIGDTFVELVHHDGHRSHITTTPAQTDVFARTLTSQPDTRTITGKQGIMSAQPFPATVSACTATFGGLIPGVFWYHIGHSTPVLYKFSAYAVVDTPPTFFLNGVELPNGTMYYNTADNAVYSKRSLVWYPITSLHSSDITPLWSVVNFQSLLANLYLEVETRLYNVTPTYNTQKFEYQISGIPVQSQTPTVASVGSYWYAPASDTLNQWTGSVWQPTVNTLSPLVLAASMSIQSNEQLTYNSYRQDRFASFVIDHNLATPMINTTYSITDPFTWNYAASVVTIAPRAGTIRPVASWQGAYNTWYGTPYPHLEPWALQGFQTKPVWWDQHYADTTGTRRWTQAMWSDILTGQTPFETPSWLVATYAYVSVNINSTTTVDGYGPDQLLPPFYAAGVGTVQSLYTNYDQIKSPSSDYAFGDIGPIEWLWMNSAQYVYDALVVAFRMQPVRFMHYAFSSHYVTVDGLQVDSMFSNVYAHQNALFHSDLYNTNQVYEARGLNQWYVNYNRYTGFDTNDQFRQQWSNWTPLLSYQVGGIVDVDTFNVSNKVFDISDQDYNIALVNTGVIQDVWVDAFKVSVLSMPPPLTQYNSQAGWKLELSTLASVMRTLTCYGTKVYSCRPDTNTGELVAMRYTIASASSSLSQLLIFGDQTHRFPQGTTFSITSLANYGTYSVQGALYQPATNTTRLSITEPIFDAGAEGYIDTHGGYISWQTGDRVVVSTTKLMPAPLLADTAYYVIKTGTNVYKLAETQQDAFANISVDLTSLGEGQLTIAEVVSTFNVFGGTQSSKDLWYHYALDTTDIITITPPYAFMSMQMLINIIDGYALYQHSRGIVYGVGEGNEFDPITGRLVDWQLEVERFIDWAYSLRNTRLTISDKYNAVVTISTKNLSFADMAPQWSHGLQVIVNSTGALPAPLRANTPYFYQSTATPGVFQLSTTGNTLDPAATVTYTSTGTGSLYVSLYNSKNVFPAFELNPIRNSIWLDTPHGVLANVIDGPYSDIRVQQTIFDQYSRPILSDKLTVYRDDKRSRITIRPNIANDINILYQNDPYNYIHFGGGHLFIEGFEHYVMFNNSTVAGNLIYNPFLGLKAARFDVDYYEKKDYSLRPTLGGFYLQAGKFKRNIEGTASDLQTLYDAHTMSDRAPATQHARALIGYAGPSKFLDLININHQSQFSFYQGMLRSKGSVNSVTAYINSRRFVDAQVDECWAWKIAEFGDIRPRVYPEIKLFSTDAFVDDIRLEFLAVSELATDPDVVDSVSKGFQLVAFNNDNRWNNFPDQKSDILSPLFLDADITSISVIYSGVLQPTAAQVLSGSLQYWYNGNNTYQWTGTDWNINSPIVGKIITVGSHTYLKHDTICDDVRVYRHTLNASTPSDFTNYATDVFIPGTGMDQYDYIGAEVVRMDNYSFRDIMMVFTVNASQKKTSPAQLVDTQSHTVLQNIPMWHPALGYHYPMAAHSLNLIQSIDPAHYQVSLTDASTNVWNQTQVDTMWLDTNQLGYLPYYDSIAYPSINDRLHVWGTLAPWSTMAVYKWTKSTVQPKDWSMQVLADSNNATMLQQNKASGSARQTVYSRTRTPIAATQVIPGIGGASQITVNSAISNQSSVLFTVSSTLTVTVPSTAGTSLFDAMNTQLYSYNTFDATVGQTIVTFNTAAPITVTTPLHIVAGSYSFTLVVNGLATTYYITATGTDTMASITTLMSVAIGSSATVTPVANTFVITTSLVGTLPAGLYASTPYTVVNVTGAGPSTFQLQDPYTLAVVDITSIGSGQLWIVPVFTASDWKRQPLIREKLYSIFDIAANVVVNEVLLHNSLWQVGDMAAVYKNGILIISSISIQIIAGVVRLDTTGLNLSLSESDIVDVVRQIHVVTPGDLAFNPDIVDAGTNNIQWLQDYEYTSTTVTTGSTATSTTTTTYYYFWVEGSINSSSTDSTILSALATSQQLQHNLMPYFVAQKPKDDPVMIAEFGYGLIQYGSVYAAETTAEQFFIIPVLYRQAILRNVASYVTDNNRFIARFVRDLTLRDNIQSNGKNMNLKNKHEEWAIFRQNQSDTLSPVLWTKLVEAIIGYTVLDNTVRVPTLERELYDNVNGTSTRFGLSPGQAFVDKSLAIVSIISYLQNPNNNFYPVDMDSFFTRNHFDTASNIYTAMMEIYNTFPSAHTNAIWFSTLQDALTSKAKYPGLMKTSWVAIHGIRVLAVGGKFDD